MPSNHLILCHPLLLPLIFPSIRVLSNELALHIRWPKYWGFSFTISPSSEYLGLISFSIDWFDLLWVQGTQESSSGPQFESINSLVLSLLYGSTLTSISWLLEKPQLWLYRPLLAKWCLCFSTHLFRFVIAFLPRSKYLLVSWLQSLSTVILKPKKIKSHCFHLFPTYLP